MAEQKSNVCQYLDVMMSSFAPAENQDKATHFFSTDEVFSAIKELDPAADISKDDIFQAMKDYGFLFMPRRGTSGLDFRWLLAAK